MNLTCEEFGEGRVVDGLFVVSVADHKTGISGPAKLMFEEELLARARQYQSMIRPLLVADGNNIPFFFYCLALGPSRRCQTCSGLWRLRQV